MSPSSTCTLCLVLVACVSHVITYPHAGVSTTTPTPPHPVCGCNAPLFYNRRQSGFILENPAAHGKPRSPRVGCGVLARGLRPKPRSPRVGWRGNPRSLHFRGCAGRRSSVFGVLGVSLICIFVLMTWHSHSSCTHDCAFSASCTYNLAFSFYALS